MRTLLVAMIVAVAGVVPIGEGVLAGDSCEEAKLDLEAELATLREEHSLLASSQYQLLETLWTKLEAESAVPSYVGDLQRKHGWADPVAVLVADLVSRPELIPEVEGSRRDLQWGNVGVISSRWVFASILEGTQESGAALLEYRIDSEGTISWERLHVASAE